MEAPVKRPTSVTVIAWVWMVMGVLVLVLVLPLFAGMVVAPLSRAAENEGRELPWGATVAICMITHFGFSTPYVPAVCIVGIVASVFALLQKVWARVVLQVLSLAGAAYVVWAAVDLVRCLLYETWGTLDRVARIGAGVALVLIVAGPLVIGFVSSIGHSGEGKR